MLSTGTPLEVGYDRLRALMGTRTVGFWQVSADGSTVAINQAMCEMLQLDGADDLKGLPYRSFFTSESLGALACGLAEPEGSSGSGHDVRLRGKLGRELDAIVSTSPVLAPDGSLEGFVAIFVDVSDRRRMEEELERSVSLLKATIESTADGLLVVDDLGRIVSHNRRFAQMWRIPEEVLAARDDDDALAFVLDQLVDPEGFLSKVRELYADPEAESSDTLLFKDGRVFERYSMPQKIGDRCVGRVWSFRDVTQRHLAEQLKHDFIAMVAHELRSPITAVVGFSSLLTRPDVDANPEARRATALRLQERGEHMARIVNDLLEVTKIETGELKLRRSDTDVCELVRSCVELVSLPPSHRVTVESVEGLGPIRCDAKRLGYAVTNLVTNAVKYSPDGGLIEVSVSAPEDRVEISVKDPGIGISQDDLGRVFERFARAVDSSGNTPEGFGMGLYIARKIAQAHGGDILVESEVGAGSKFTIVLPRTGAAR